MRLVYDMNNAKIYQGDARQMDVLQDGSVHLCITSPPYYNARDYSQWGSYQEYLDDMAEAWRECCRVLCDGGRIAVNVPQGYGRCGQGGYISIGDHTTQALVSAGFTLRGHIVWVKGNDNTPTNANGTAWGSWMSASNPSLRDCHELIIVASKGSLGRDAGQSTISREDFLTCTRSVWSIRPRQHSWHPAPFPAELPRRLIQLYSYAGDVVLDPFAGSCTTVWVAAENGRQGIGIEKSSTYIEQACGPMFLQERKR